MNPILEVKNLSVDINYEGKTLRILRDISYKVQAGSTLAVVGESGSGKTINALAIPGLLPGAAKITSGQILYKDRELTSLPEPELRKIRGSGISMVFQEPMTSLNPVLTIGRQIAETIVEHKKTTMKEALRQSAILLEKVGIQNAADRINDYPHHFSGGMRQRVMIAIALSCGPDLIIADEPTTALDVTIQAQILELFAKLRAETSMSLMLITHNLGIVAKYADEVIVLYAGRIMERATARQLFETPQHPYTKALLESLPKLDGNKEPLATIPGLPPGFEIETSGCPFHPRCRCAMEKCRKEEPPEFQIGEGRAAKCWMKDGGRLS